MPRGTSRDCRPAAATIHSMVARRPWPCLHCPSARARSARASGLNQNGTCADRNDRYGFEIHRVAYHSILIRRLEPICTDGIPCYSYPISRAAALAKYSRLRASRESCSDRARNRALRVTRAASGAPKTAKSPSPRTVHYIAALASDQARIVSKWLENRETSSARALGEVCEARNRRKRRHLAAAGGEDCRLTARVYSARFPPLLRATSACSRDRFAAPAAPRSRGSRLASRAGSSRDTPSTSITRDASIGLEIFLETLDQGHPRTVHHVTPAIGDHAFMLRRSR